MLYPLRYRNLSFVFLFTIHFLMGQTVDFQTHFEKSSGLETATYEQTIAFYTALSEAYPDLAIDSIGKTDSGKPLHYVILNMDRNFNFSDIKQNNKRIMLINNGIHPGEPDGIDATMLLFRDIVQGKIPIPEHTVLVTIPLYNIGGSLNRNSKTRTNQNGPEVYGFRGNARNYDLNRDFVKCDTKNAQAFNLLYHKMQPDVFIDTHVSNGADYQYTLSHLFTQHNKLGGELGWYLHTRMMPKLEEKLSEKQWDITPYVNVFNSPPEQGFSQFFDTPRYSTGYTGLFNTLGMMVETHMLKPYKQRVKGTYVLLRSMIDIMEEDADTIATLRAKAFHKYRIGDSYPILWTLDTNRTTLINFKGYEAQILQSAVTGHERLRYDRESPYTKTIAYQNNFVPQLEITIPKAYIIPQGWHRILDLLKLNGVEMIPLEKDSLIQTESYRITHFETVETPFEGHYLHKNTRVNNFKGTHMFRAGDLIVPTRQYAMRYLLETLEPMAVDSFFNWNFFDTILQQKEHFSPYVWEDKALEMLNNNVQLKEDFENRKRQDSAFSENWYAQLDWLHKQSDYYEKAHLHYPIHRIHP